jgi:hypothetical protein
MRFDRAISALLEAADGVIRSTATSDSQRHPDPAFGEQLTAAARALHAAQLAAAARSGEDTHANVRLCNRLRPWRGCCSSTGSCPNSRRRRGWSWRRQPPRAAAPTWPVPTWAAVAGRQQGRGRAARSAVSAACHTAARHAPTLTGGQGGTGRCARRWQLRGRRKRRGSGLSIGRPCEPLIGAA